MLTAGMYAHITASPNKVEAKPPANWLLTLLQSSWQHHKSPAWQANKGLCCDVANCSATISSCMHQSSGFAQIPTCNSAVIAGTCTQLCSVTAH
jgi:hypothetical protein